MKGVLVLLLVTWINMGYGNRCINHQGHLVELPIKHNDCNKFYKCTNKGPVVMFCPSGLYFNPSTLECDQKQNVYCSSDNWKKNEKIITEWDGEKDLKQMTNLEVEKHNHSSSELKHSEMSFLENGCPLNPYTHWLLPDKNDCNVFYYCISGEKVKKTCPGALHFNYKLQVCDWPEVAGCSQSSEDSSLEEENSTEAISEEDISEPDMSEEDNTEIDNSEENNSEVNASNEDDSDVDASDEVNSEVEDSEEDNSEVNISEEDNSEANNSEEDLSESDTAEVGNSKEYGKTDSELFKKITAAVNVKLLNILV